MSRTSKEGVKEDLGGGGAVALRGFLYQILGTLDRAARLTTRTRMGRNGELASAQLVIEPMNGGDLQITDATTRIVEQWKTKRDGQWTIGEISSRVLPDLYRAIDADDLDGNSVYRFVTEASLYDFSTARTFFARLSRTTPSNPLEHLDSKTKRRFLRSKQQTEVEFFLDLAARLRAKRDIEKRDKDERISHRKLWHLLARLQVERQSLEELDSKITSFLLEIVNYRDELRSIRNELIGILLGLAAAGHAVLSPIDLLKEAGLSQKPLGKWAERKTEARGLLLRGLNRSANYSMAEDVRLEVSPTLNSSIVLLSGESGQGKTWQLGRTALEIAQRERGLVVFINASGKTENDIAQATDILKQLFGWDRPVDLVSVSRRIRQIHPNMSNPLLTICVDDVRSAVELNGFFGPQYDWDQLGVRLVLTTTPHLANAAQRRWGDHLEVIPVLDFTKEELRRFLRRHRLDWSDVPADLRDLLCRPLLAKIFSRTVSGSWRPQNEYELFKEYWGRISFDKEQPDHPGDAVGLQELISSHVLQDEPYPWLHWLKSISGLGLGPEWCGRLVSVGWLRHYDDARIEMAHDRLLNWAVAETLLALYRGRKISAQDLGSLLSRLFAGAQLSGKTLGYVPMDFLWLAIHSDLPVPDVTPLVVALAESERSSADSFFETYVPTLGPRAIPVLVDLIRTVRKGAPNDYPRLVSQALVAIGKAAPKSLEEPTVELLTDSTPESKETGIRILAHVPNSRALETLWPLHVKNWEAYNSDINRDTGYQYELSFAAMMACAGRDPGWIRHKIETSTQPLSEFAHLLASLPGGEMVNIWHDTKQILYKGVPAKKVRAFFRCIRRFKDPEFVDYVKSFSDREDHGTAWFVLPTVAAVDPDAALEMLSHASVKHMLGGGWLDELLLIRRSEVLAVLRSRLSTGQFDIRVLSGYENDLDPTTIDILLDILRRELQQSIQTGSPTRRTRDLLELLEKVARQDLIELYTQRRGSDLEALLTEFGSSCVGSGEWTLGRECLGPVRKVLLKISGNGLTQLVNTELSHDNARVRYRGLRFAQYGPDSQTLSLLRLIARDTTSTYPPETARAFYLLLALGDVDTAVEAVLDGVEVPEDLRFWHFRDENPPLSDSIQTRIREGLEAVVGPLVYRYLHATSVTGATELVPQVRSAIQRNKTDPRTVFKGIRTLVSLGSQANELVPMVEPFLRSHEAEAMDSLAAIGSSDSVDRLMQELENKGNALEEVHLRILSKAAEKSSVHLDAIADILVRASSRLPTHRLSPESFSVLARSRNSEAHDLVINQAFDAPQLACPAIGRAAIRALSLVDSTLAFEAARKAVEGAPRAREMYVQLIPELEPEVGPGLLLGRLVFEKECLVRWEICRQLRRHSAPSQLSEKLVRMLTSELQADIVAGIEVAGWQASGFEAELESLSSFAYDARVRDAAREALRLRRRHEYVSSLMSHFGEAEGVLRWSILESILDLGDPFLLGREGDPVWLGNILREERWVYAHRARDSFKTKRSGLEKRARSIDRSYSRYSV